MSPLKKHRTTKGQCFSFSPDHSSGSNVKASGRSNLLITDKLVPARRPALSMQGAQRFSSISWTQDRK